MTRRLIQYPKRRLAARLVALAAMLAFYLFMTGEPADSLYIIYQNASAQNKLQGANDIFKRLKQEEFTDSLMQFHKGTEQEVVDAHVHYRMAEYYYDQEDFAAEL